MLQEKVEKKPYLYQMKRESEVDGWLINSDIDKQRGDR